KTPQYQQLQKPITDIDESFPNLTRVSSHSSTTSLIILPSSTTSLIILPSQSSSTFESYQPTIPSSSSYQSISKLSNVSNDSKNYLGQHFDRLEQLLQSLEKKQNIKEKQQFAVSEYDQPTDITQTSNANISIKSKSNIKSSKNSNTKIIKNTKATHKQNPKPHISNITNAPYTGHLADQEAPDIDFSLISSDAPELERVVWGPSGPPATLSLAQYGISVPTPEILQLQRRQRIVDNQLDKQAFQNDDNEMMMQTVQQQIQEEEQHDQNDTEQKMKEKHQRKSLQRQNNVPPKILSPIQEDID
ncbi:MAG: hypothetical protein EZS28_019106, partial [Streblomastix strix]